eukprot:4880435-Pyramimonas_sp.AAC.1
MTEWRQQTACQDSSPVAVRPVQAFHVKTRRGATRRGGEGSRSPSFAAGPDVSTSPFRAEEP